MKAAQGYPAAPQPPGYAYAPPPPGQGPPQYPGGYPAAAPNPSYASVPPDGHPSGYAMQAPSAQAMTATAGVQLGQLQGVVVRQVTQMAEAIAQSFGIPYESKNKYEIKGLPNGKHAARLQGQPDRWNPRGEELAAIPTFMMAQEESSLCTRIGMACLGCLNLRPLTMHFSDFTGERFRANRPCKLGGSCCCPLEMTLWEVQGGHPTRMMGKVEEDYSPYCGKCCEAMWTCTTYAKVMPADASGQLSHSFTLRTNLCCCGRVNNCCGATCFRPDLIIDILDAKTGQLAATIQKVYGRTSGCGACCRMAYQFDNFILEFPPTSTPDERALLLTALLHVDYQLFEKTGDENNNNGAALAF